MNPTLSDIATILRTTEKNAPARIVALKLGDTCSRCCGSGSYSSCQMYGTRCFRCHGSGQTMPKNLKTLLPRAEAVANDGTLDAYIQRLRDAQAAKNAVAKIMAAWKQAEKLNGYEKIWRELTRNPEPHAETVRRNSTCHAAYERVQKATTTLAGHEVLPVLTVALAEIAAVQAELDALFPAVIAA